MKYKNSILMFMFLLVTILMTANISAVVTPQSSADEGKGIDIQFPQQDVLKQNEAIEINFYVFNRSDGLRLTNATTSCIVHLYGTNGSHIFQDNAGFNINGIDFNFDLPATNTTEVGIHKFIISCNSTTEGGFISGNFRITTTGDEITLEGMLIYLTALTFLIFLALTTFYLVNKLPSMDSISDNGKIIDVNMLKHLRPVLLGFVWLIGLTCLFIIQNLGTAYLSSDNLIIAELFFVLYTIFFWLTIVAIPLYFIWIFHRIWQDKEMKRMLERGVEFKSTTGYSP